MKKKVIFLGGKEIGYECLRLLYKKSNILNIEILGVDISLRGEKIKEFVKNVNLKCLNGKIPKCDIIISVQYHRILSDKEIKMASCRAINLHMAPLPEYRGCNQFSFAIIDNVTEFGTTLHEMVPSIDAGPIVAEKRFKVDSNIWVEDLFNLTFDKSLELFEEQLPNLISGKYCAINQNHILPKKGTYFHTRNEIDSIKRIKFQWEKEKIHRHIRATMMPGFEPPYVVISGKKVYLCIKKGS